MRVGQVVDEQDPEAADGAIVQRLRGIRRRRAEGIEWRPVVHDLATGTQIWSGAPLPPVKELDGYGAELVTLEPEFAVKLDPALGLLGVLTEPTSVVAKAWEQIDALRSTACRPLASALIIAARSSRSRSGTR